MALEEIFGSELGANTVDNDQSATQSTGSAVNQTSSNQGVDLPPNNPGISSLVTTQMVEQATPSPGVIGASPEDLETVRLLRQQFESPSAGLTNQDLFPGLNEPILKGVSSSQTLGSQPIFVGSGGPFPVAAIDKRQAALQNAAQQRAQQLRKFDLQKPPTIGDSRFQQSINDSFKLGRDQFIDRARREFGEDWDLALTSQATEIGRDWLSFVDGLDVLAREGDQIIDLMAEIDAGIESTDFVYSDETIALRDQFNQLLGAFDGGDVQGLVSMRNQLNKLEGFASLDRFLNDRKFLTKIGGELVQRSGVQDFAEYLQVTDVTSKDFDRDVSIIASDLAKRELAQGVRAGVYTEEDIKNHLKAVLGSEKKTDISVKTKPRGGSVRIDLDPNQLTTQAQKDIRTETGETFSGRNAVELRTGKDAFINMSGTKMFNPDGTSFISRGTEQVKPTNFMDVDIPTPDGGSKTVQALVGRIDDQVIRSKTTGEILTPQEVERQQLEPSEVSIEDVSRTVIIDASEQGGNAARFRTEMPNAYNHYLSKSGGNQIRRVSVPGF